MPKQGPMRTNPNQTTPKRCPILGIELKAEVGSGRPGGTSNYHAPQLDRIDSSKGYNLKYIWNFGNGEAYGRLLGPTEPVGQVPMEERALDGQQTCVRNDI